MNRQRPGVRWLRRVGGGAHLEALLIAAVSVVLAVRAYLFATGYPQMGGGGLHIAHLLWGGLGLLVAVVFLLTFAGEGVCRWAAIIAGGGFGLFIDELGKFITSDNNYFFQPAVALIYVTFVAMWLAFRMLARRPAPTSAEALADALALLGDAALHGLTPSRRTQVQGLLGAARHDDPLAVALTAAVGRIALVPERDGTPVARPAAQARAWLRDVTHWRWARRGVVALLAFNAGGAVLSLALAVVHDPRFALHQPALGFVDGVTMTATAVAGAMTVYGVLRLWRAPAAGVAWLRRAVLLSLFVVRPFVFYHEEMAAVFGLGGDLFILLVLDGMARAQADGGPARSPATAARMMAAS